MEGGASASASARRRRLVERGSDRLAFITGQARSLPTDPYPDSPLSAVDAASPQPSEKQPSAGDIGVDRFSNIIQLQKSEPSDLVPEFQPTGESSQEKPQDKTRSNESDLIQKFKTSTTVSEIQPVYETPLQTNDNPTLSKKNDGVANAQSRREMGMRPRSMPSNQFNQAKNTGWSVETLKEHLNFTPHEVSQAISVTEYNRFLASIVVAFLVVLSTWGLDIGGSITRVLVGTRPLLFLIITNITIVVTLLMENKDPNTRGRPGSTNLGSADSLGQMLEIGLLLQKALNALLMDCSVCAVIMICFLGF